MSGKFKKMRRKPEINKLISRNTAKMHDRYQKADGAEAPNHQIVHERNNHFPTLLSLSSNSLTHNSCKLAQNNNYNIAPRTPNRTENRFCGFFFCSSCCCCCKSLVRFRFVVNCRLRLSTARTHDVFLIFFCFCIQRYSVE